jgi:hypothetical protein
MEGDFIVEVLEGENSSNAVASTRRIGQAVNRSQQDAFTGLLGNYDIVDYKTLAACQREEQRGVRSSFVCLLVIKRCHQGLMIWSPIHYNSESLSLGAKGNRDISGGPIL